MKNSDGPSHISIIPDGNRRWARSKGFEASYGHLKGGDYEHVRSLFLEAKESGVKYVSMWAFSTENWSRLKREKDAIFGLISDSIEKFRKDASKDGIRFWHIGRKDRLPNDIISHLSKLEKETENFKELNVLLCLDYGGRDEIIRAVNKAIKSGLNEVDESKFSEFLDTYNIPDVDLIIRTGGEKRSSGFMPFQSVYSELYFSETHFPDFDTRELRKA